MLLDWDMDRLYSHFESYWNDGESHQLHYVKAREMFNIVKESEIRGNGKPDHYRDYFLLSN
jgi:hypothetical protein